MTYEATITWLFEQFPAYHLQGVSAYKPSLDNIRTLAAAFGNPEKKLRFIHVAGTNGKGSTSNMLASILTESGEQTGLFTSPHIHDFRERIRINGECISEQFVIDFCAEVRQRTWEIQPSFFEITWLMALCYFRDCECSVVVAETGLGGRLDATNIITPLVSVITNISLDHTAILGNTRQEIAREKAGIIKENIPTVLGEPDQEILPVFEEIAKTNNSNLILPEKPEFVPDAIFGYQRINYQTVYTTIQQLRLLEFSISNETVERGINKLRQNTGFIGRLEQVRQEPLVILDVAHNPAGIRQTISSIREKLQGTLHIVYGTSSDKNISEIASELPSDARYYITTFQNPRSATLPQLTEVFTNRYANVNFFENSFEAYKAAELIANKTDTILITGSFFLISDFFDFFFK